MKETIVTSSMARGTRLGLQLFASPQSLLLEPAHEIAIGGITSKAMKRGSNTPVTRSSTPVPSRFDRWILLALISVQ